jgi:hypothetical protein
MQPIGRRLVAGVLLVLVFALLYLLQAVLWVQSARLSVPPVGGTPMTWTQGAGP